MYRIRERDTSRYPLRAPYPTDRALAATMVNVAGYSGTPLARKLGIAPGGSVLLDGAPDGFTIEDVPAGVTIHRRASRGGYDTIVCFCRSSGRLATRWPTLHTRTTPAGSLWIAWPKRTSGLATDLDENV